MNTTCYACGCGIRMHSERGCHGVQAMVPWDREPCICTLTPEQAAGIDTSAARPLAELELEGIGAE